MINLIIGGNLQKKGYVYRINLAHPTYQKSITRNLFRQEHSHRSIELPTHILISSSRVYFSLDVRLLGFGIFLEIQTNDVDNI